MSACPFCWKFPCHHGHTGPRPPETQDAPPSYFGTAPMRNQCQCSNHKHWMPQCLSRQSQLRLHLVSCLWIYRLGCSSAFGILHSDNQFISWTYVINCNLFHILRIHPSINKLVNHFYNWTSGKSISLSEKKVLKTMHKCTLYQIIWHADPSTKSDQRRNTIDQWDPMLSYAGREQKPGNQGNHLKRWWLWSIIVVIIRFSPFQHS